MGFFLVWPQVDDGPRDRIPPLLSSVLPSCPEAAKASISDRFLSGSIYARNPFEAAPAMPARKDLRFTDDPLKSAGLVARYVRDCEAKFALNPPSSVRLRTTLALMENEASARAAVDGLPDLLDDFEVWVHPASAQLKVVGDRILSAIASEVDGLYVAYSERIRSFDSRRGKLGTALMEDWIAAWQAGSYVITVEVSVDDQNYFHLPTARLGVVSSRTFDGWHLLGQISLDLVNGWPLEDGGRLQIKPTVSSYRALLRHCAPSSEPIFQELVREGVLGLFRNNAPRELSGVQFACVYIVDPAKQADLESRAARSGRDFCETLYARQLQFLIGGGSPPDIDEIHLVRLDSVFFGCLKQYTVLN